MQEVLKDGSEGKTFVENTIEELLPHIKKSLEDPKVKYVKVFRANKLLTGLRAKVEIKFTAEEEKKDLIEQIIEDDKKEKKKNAPILIDKE